MTPDQLKLLLAVHDHAGRKQAKRYLWDITGDGSAWMLDAYLTDARATPGALEFAARQGPEIAAVIRLERNRRTLARIERENADLTQSQRRDTVPA